MRLRPPLAALLAPALALVPAACSKKPEPAPEAALVAARDRGSAAAEDSVPAIVERCFAAYGGSAGLERSARSFAEGTVTSVVLRPGVTGRIARAHERPGRLRVEILYPGGQGEIRVLDGGRGWRDGKEAAGPALDAMILQAARLDLPALLRSWVAKVKDGGKADLDGTEVRLLAIEPAPGLLVEAAIDPATGRILRSRGASTEGVALEFATTYSDFQVVEDVLVPMREENWASGRSTGVTLLRKVTFPEAWPKIMFAP